LTDSSQSSTVLTPLGSTNLPVWIGALPPPDGDTLPSAARTSSKAECGAAGVGCASDDAASGRGEFELAEPGRAGPVALDDPNKDSDGTPAAECGFTIGEPFPAAESACAAVDRGDKNEKIVDLCGTGTAGAAAGVDATTGLRGEAVDRVGAD